MSSAAPTNTTAGASSMGASLGPWLWGPGVDLAVFGGSAVFALGVVAVGHATGLSPGELPPWGWLVFVLVVDVAHVYSTLFRTYFDRDELGRHPMRYTLAPLVAFGIGVLLYSLGGPFLFWRVLAYVAVFHFMRQQVGWVALYRARAAQRGRVDRLIDDAAVYLATGYPVVFWHAHLGERQFSWFMAGDFVETGAVARVLEPVFHVAWAVALLGFVVRQLQLRWATGVLHLGKVTVVAATAAIWWVGIVGTNNDFDFTVTNVIVHGVPYFALLYAYGRARRREAPSTLGSRILRGGLPAFLGVLLLLAFGEELLWDHLVYAQRQWLFGASELDLDQSLLALVVPLLSVPQFTHYLLDGVLWRRRDSRDNAAQRAAIGYGT